MGTQKTLLLAAGGAVAVFLFLKYSRRSQATTAQQFANDAGALGAAAAGSAAAWSNPLGAFDVGALNFGFDPVSWPGSTAGGGV